MYIWNTSIPFRLPHRLILAQPGASPGTRWSQNIASLTSTPGIVTLNGLVKKKRIKSSLRHFFFHKLGPSKVSINLDVCRLEYFVIRPSMSTWELRNITTDIFWQTCYIARTFTLNFLIILFLSMRNSGRKRSLSNWRKQQTNQGMSHFNMFTQ